MCPIWPCERPACWLCRVAGHPYSAITQRFSDGPRSHCYIVSPENCSESNFLKATIMPD